MEELVSFHSFGIQFIIFNLILETKIPDWLSAVKFCSFYFFYIEKSLEGLLKIKINIGLFVKMEFN